MKTILFLALILIASCSDNVSVDITGKQDNIVVNKDTVMPVPLSKDTVETNIADIDKIVDYAETLIGVPYKYASTDPGLGFDCSGFITHVFNHFNIKVPRSSVDFTNEGRPISLANARRGDLILFTGTDSTRRIVGHMGIVTRNSDTLKFIHSSSGKANGVVITPLNKYYHGRFMKVIRMFIHP